MPIFLQEDSKELNKQKYHLSQKGRENLQAAITQMETMGLEKQAGYKMLKHLQDDEYNKGKKTNKDKFVKNPNVHTPLDKQEKKDEGVGNKTVEGGIHDNKVSTNKTTHAFTDWVYGRNGELTLKHKNAQARTNNYAKAPKIPHVKKVEVPKVSNKPLKCKNGSMVHIIQEESDDWHSYYDCVADYDTYYVFDHFMQDKRDNGGKNTIWFPLINPYEYQKALNDFSKFGKLPEVLGKKVYQWIGIIMKNTAILRACTDICGHLDMYSCTNEFLDYFFEGDEQQFKDYANENDIYYEDGEDFYNMEHYLDSLGFYEWCVAPDGSQAYTDYGLKPLEKLIIQYNDNMTPEQTLVLVNKLLDVYHQRGDLSSMFIKGGKSSLTKISNAYMAERKEQIKKRILEYRNQLNIPFEEFGGGKQSYEHYLDYLENIGTFGQLPPSKLSVEDAMAQAIPYANASNHIGEDLVYEFCQMVVNSSTLSNEQKQDYFNNFEYVCTQINDNFQNPDLDFERDLTNDGKQAYFEYYYENGFPDDLTINDNGLIYIERSIQLRDMASPYSNRDIYPNYSQRYKNLGVCWSWAEGGGSDFADDNLDANSSPIFILQGWVRPEDVDWPSTIELNSDVLGFERELRLKKDAPIQLERIYWENITKLIPLPLKNSIIVRA